MVPDADFRSYYGRPVVKASPWGADIPAYLFLGGLAGASSLLAEGAAAVGLPQLRRVSRLGAVAAVTASFAALVHDLGRPARFHHMLRVAKPTSPMSVGTWILSVYGPMAGLAAAGELVPALGPAAGAAGAVAGAIGPAVASYTAILLADTATPTWHDARRHLPVVFVSSAAAAAGGLGMLAAPLAESGPARALGVAGGLAELAATQRMEAGIGISAETFHAGAAGRYMKLARALSVTGVAVGSVAGRRSRAAAAAAGVCLLAGSAATRFGIFHAGQQSARDPRYSVVPQRARLNARRSPPPT